jgi:tryptophan 2,3-dioxygenase
MVAKRFRHGLRVVRPALDRLGLLADIDEGEPAEAVRRLTALVAEKFDAVEQTEMRLSMLPVWVAHDEYLFIRVLQSFESTFGLLAAQLTTAIRAVDEGRPGRAAELLGEADIALGESAPLFSLLATMTIESFRTFRDWTEGASAIQSRNYKMVEALCRRPDQERLDAAAFRQVPEIRRRVLDGQPNLEDAIAAARTAGRLDPAAVDGLDRAMERFAATLQHWRRTHYRIAVRMLGERTGTGYTEGTPYLARVRDITVFRSIGAPPEQADPHPPEER